MTKTKPGPIQVWVKQCGEWNCVFDTHSPPEARDYARERIGYGPRSNVERVQIRDNFGGEVLETVYDKAWGFYQGKGV